MQAMLNEGDAYLCTTEDEIDGARARLLADSHGLGAGDCPVYLLPGAECSKANQNVVDVVTATGVKQISVPTT